MCQALFRYIEQDRHDPYSMDFNLLRGDRILQYSLNDALAE